MAGASVEIAPIAGIRVVPTTRSRPVDPELTAAFEIESPARPDEDSYTGSGKKAAGAEEPAEKDEEDPDTPLNEDAPQAARGPTGNISYFA